MPIQSVNNSGQNLKGLQSIQTVLNACALVMDKSWQQKTLLVAALSASYINIDWVRLPIYIVCDDADLIVLRTVLVELVDVLGVSCQTLSQNTLLRSFAQKQSLILDLTMATEALFYQVRHLAYLRGIPGNFLDSMPIGGDTWVIIPEDFVELVGLFGIVWRLEQVGAQYPSLAEVKSALQPWHSGVKEIAIRAAKEITLNPNDLPPSRFIPGAVRRAYLSLAAIARWLDTNSGTDGFLDAVRECWREAEHRASMRTPSHLINSLTAYYLLAYISDPEHPEHCAQGYRLDLLAEYLSGADPEYFSACNATELGKALMRLGVGTHRRHVFSGGKGKALRIWRSCVALSVADKSKLEEKCHEL